MNHPYIWLGIRESDISYTNNLFCGSVTIFGSNRNGNHSMEYKTGIRIDHNRDCPGYLSFFQNEIQHILEDNPEIRFIQYDSLDCSSLPDEFQRKFIFQNDYRLLNELGKKIHVKQMLSDKVPVLPYRLLHWHECNIENLRRFFPSDEKFVIQRDFSCGGSGTFLITHADVSDGIPELPEDEICMVTPFQEHGISVNIHSIIYPEDIILFSPSIQIIDQEHTCLEYLGSDYSAYQTLTEEEQLRVTENAYTICKVLQMRGYRGICGIDMLLTDNNCYFMEINARFQASSALLNRNLAENGFPSLHEYHCDAFLHDKATLPMPPHVSRGSFLTVHYREAQKEQLLWMRNTVKESKDFSLCDDNLNWNFDMEEGCYAFQIYKDTQISSVTFQHTLRLHPNLYFSSFSITDAEDYNNLLQIKLLLLARGVSITPDAWATAKLIGGVDWWEFSAVTLHLFHRFWVTAPCMEVWHSLSPLQLDADMESQTFVLNYYGKRLFPVEVMPEDSHGKRQTSGGHDYRDIAYLNPDRLRIYHRDGCILQNQGKGCQFCDLYGVGTPFQFSEVEEVLSSYWDNPRIEHFLIGGGSGSSKEEYDKILQLANYLHIHSTKNIYLMSQPVKRPDQLQNLYEHGITEVAFNIEVFDPAIAREIMPGKSKHTLEDYLTSLRHAVSIWGRNGAVRSAVLVGFDDIHTFKNGIQKLCEAGVTPILSLFRPCPGTPLEHYMPLREDDVLEFYQTAYDVCKEYGLRPGPSCKACQNNTIALEFD